MYTVSNVTDGHCGANSAHGDFNPPLFYSACRQKALTLIAIPAMAAFLLSLFQKYHLHVISATTTTSRQPNYVQLLKQNFPTPSYFYSYTG